ncbi:tRNA adenosine deaminase-associated protein [Thalassiella azotivora]
MSYFTAVMASDGDGWRTRDVDVEDAASLDDLADSLRGLSREGEPVLAVIEHEDEWFALVRVDGDDDPRVFVSDALAASRGAFAELLAPATDVDAPFAGAGDDEDDDGVVTVDDDDPDGTAAEAEEDVDLGDLDGDDPEPPPPWAGHTDLLADKGVDPTHLVDLCEKNPDDPAAVLADIGERAGFDELLEALR